MLKVMEVKVHKQRQKYKEKTVPRRAVYICNEY